MGACVNQKRKTSTPSKSNTCPICFNNFDDQQRKYQQVCSLPHALCRTCITSIKIYNSLNKKDANRCPLCKEVWSQDKLKNIVGDVNGSILQLQDIVKALPENRKKLFVFTTVYLPALNKLIRQNNKLEGIDALRIKGRMVQEQQIFLMDMLDCLVNLRRLYLKNSSIEAIDSSRYTSEKLQLLNLNNTKIFSMKNLLDENKRAFKYLRQLTLKRSQIAEISGLEQLRYLQSLDLSYNRISSMKGLNNLDELKDLNVEFNSMTNFEYYPAFKGLMSLSLYGNRLGVAVWEGFLKDNWEELRLLTVTVDAVDSVTKLAVHKKLKQHTWGYLQLLIAELDQPENISDFLKKDIVVERLYLVEIAKENYQFYLSKSSKLSRAIKKAKRYDRLGANMNFRVSVFNKQVYDINQNVNRIKRIGKPIDKEEYLFHYQLVKVEDEQKKQIAFRTKGRSVVLGVVIDEGNQFTIDLGRKVCRYMKEQQPLSSKYSHMVKQEQGEIEYVLTVDSKNGQILLYANKNKICHRQIDRIQRQYKFFIGLEKEGDEITVIRSQGE